MATCNEIQSFPLFLIQPWSVMVFCPCCLMEGFSEVIPVTVVTSFPRRLVIAAAIGKLAGNASRASEGERAPEGSPARRLRVRTQRAGHQQMKLRRLFPAMGPCRLSFLAGEPGISLSFVTCVSRLHPLAWSTNPPPLDSVSREGVLAGSRGWN